MIEITTSSRYKINRSLIKHSAEQILQDQGVDGTYTLNIVFVGKTKMKDISNKYKNEDVALPVLSFKYNEPIEGKKLLGEIMICYPQAVLLAAERNRRVDDTILQLIDHGIKNLLKI
ncbi:MAG: rRNA maturation RNase YbeY [Patescibacteria group bacterium]